VSALRADDPETLLRVIGQDATWTADGGGKVPSFRRVVRGAKRIVRMLRGLERKGHGIVRHQIGDVNGEPALLAYAGDRLFCATAVV